RRSPAPLNRWPRSRRGPPSASAAARRCARGLGRKNRSRSARMGTSGRTAGPTRGWMGAHAPITTVFVPETKFSGEMMRLSSFDPLAALAAIRPLVATGGERVQRLQTAELAADFQPSAIAIRSSSRLLRGRRRCPAFREAAHPQPVRARGRAALFSPDHRIHLRAGLHHDGARTRSGRGCSSGSSSGSSSSGGAGMVVAGLKHVALAAAASFLCASAAAQQKLDKVSFGTNWVAEAEHGGHYQALVDGTYRRYGLDVTIVPGGPNVNNRLLLPVGKLD